MPPSVIASEYMQAHSDFWGTKPLVISNTPKNRKLLKAIEENVTKLRTTPGIFFRTLFHWVRKTSRTTRTHGLSLAASPKALEIFNKEIKAIFMQYGTAEGFDTKEKQVAKAIVQSAQLCDQYEKRGCGVHMLVQMLSPFYLALRSDLWGWLNTTRLFEVREAHNYLTNNPGVCKTAQQLAQ